MVKKIDIDIVSVKLIRESSVRYSSEKIATPNDIANLCRNFLEQADREICLLICLDNKNKPTAIHTISVGTVNASLVHPREVFKTAILANAVRIVLAHNHPSGDPEPSKEDIEITKRLIEAGKIIGIELLDHIVIGEKRFVSFKEKNLI